MSPTRKTTLTALLTLAVAHSLRADPTTAGTITISGSTAFKAFFQSPGSTNDFIDVNNDGIAGFSNSDPFVQQLAPAVTLSSGGAVTGYTTGDINGASTVAQWSVQYRGTGSVNGISELVNYNLAGAIPAPTSLGDPSYLNRTQVSASGVTAYTGPGGFPTGTPMTSVDIGVSDVIIPWATQGAPGATSWNARPAAAGYGQNPVAPFLATTQTNTLASLSFTDPTTHVTTSLNTNTTAPNAQTIFGTGLAFAPISFVANHGTGIQNLTQSQLGFLYVTGRMPDGTNLIAATRDIGSGTRNGAMNSVGVDPSYGTGENVGNITTNATQEQLGAAFQPSNLDATGSMVSVVKNSRLAVGYVSTTNGAADQAAGNYETLGIQFNLEGGTAFVRPTASSLVNNTDPNSAYRVGGTETFATVGDPYATSVNAAYPALNSNPQMANTAAADYIRNIEASVASYNVNPNATSNTFMPAQALVASNFIPQDAPQYIQDPSNPTNWIPNPNYSASVSSAALAIAGLNTGAYGSGTATFGVVPSRASGAYSDGQTAAYRFFDSTGALQTVNAGMALNARNAIEGDFNNTGVRNLAQIPSMMAAVANPAAWAQANNSGTVGVSLGNAAIPEILGDFNGDGNFDAADIRYYADGLAVDPSTGMVNRKAAFTAVDANWTASATGHPAGNYFNTSLATGHAYVAGDSRGDIAGSVAGPDAGGSASGADGVINAQDIDYVKSQILEATGQTSIQPTNPAVPTADVNGVFSTLLTRATANPLVNVRADFSADINGDGKINADDLTDLVTNILGTTVGDTNLDGHVTLTDLSTVLSNLGARDSSWASGNFDGAATIDLTDLNDVLNNLSVSAPSGTSVTATPEPASLTLLTLGTALLLTRRKKA
jgi:hypothetical protein